MSTSPSGTRLAATRTRDEAGEDLAAATAGLPGATTSSVNVRSDSIVNLLPQGLLRQQTLRRDEDYLHAPQVCARKAAHRIDACEERIGGGALVARVHGDEREAVVEIGVGDV